MNAIIQEQSRIAKYKLQPLDKIKPPLADFYTAKKCDIKLSLADKFMEADKFKMRISKLYSYRSTEILRLKNELQKLVMAQISLLYHARTLASNPSKASNIF